MIKLKAPSIRQLLSTAFFAACAFAPAAASAQQARWSVDPKTSLVWWQVNPHHGHLWGTTCPRDPSWQPGEGHSAGYYINMATRPKIKTTHTMESRVPLFPRRTVRALCSPVVKGSFTSTDARSFKGVKGVVTFNPDSLTNGAQARDVFARKFIFETMKYPEVTFTLDSLYQPQTGDTLQAIAIGTLELRGTKKTFGVPVRAWQEPGGVRVQGTFFMPSDDLHKTFGVSKIKMGAGIGLKLWETLHMGFDVMLKPETGSADDS